MKTYPLYIAGCEVYSDQTWPCRDVFSNEQFASVSVGNAEHIEQAISSGYDAKGEMAKLKAYERKNILLEIKENITHKSEHLAKIITSESGKTINEARAEIQRAISTFEYAAIEVMNRDGSILSMDTHPSSQDYECLIKRFPKGLCSFITPFNFPINLIVHKVAPAIAAGCPFIIKPSDKTPVSAIEFGKILSETSLPKMAFSVIPCSVEDSMALVTDDRPAFLSFTGSDQVGWKLKSLSGRKSVCLELGGIASCAIYPDTNIKDAVKDLTKAAFSQAGQSCISLQQLYIHDEIYDQVRQELIDQTKIITPSNPHNELSQLGPMISEAALKNNDELIKDAIEKGAVRLTGESIGKKLTSPTLLEFVPKNALIRTKEAFAPILVLNKFSHNDELLKELNDSSYGIHFGIYTNDISLAFKAWEELECAGILINQVPTWRSDKMPYGGIKNSGIGREGLKYAIDEMTELKTLTIKKR